MIPDCDPVKLTASMPNWVSAIESNAMVTRSPVLTNMSSSRRGGSAARLRAKDSKFSVVLPMALTTTTTSRPEPRVAATWRATCWIFSGSATDDPPYF